MEKDIGYKLIKSINLCLSIFSFSSKSEYLDLLERIVNDAIETGYRKFDTAASYFNEEQLGNAIRHSGMKREEFFITTKLWVQDYEYDDALRAFDLSMKSSGWIIWTST